MAALTLSVVTAALSQLFAPDFHAQYNRQAVVASKLTVKPGGGKNVAWDVKFGARTASAYNDGDSSYLAATSDTPVPATLNFAYYDAPFSISSGAYDAAMSSGGTPAALMDLFRDSALDAARSLASLINSDVINGTGTDGSGKGTIVGFLGGALAASGTYANIARATYATWAGNVLANGGTPRANSITLMDSVDQTLFTSCGESADLIVMGPAQQTKYKGLFTSYTQQMQGSSGQVTSVGAGTNNLTYNGVPIIRDKDMAAGKVLFLNTHCCEIVFLPFASAGLDGAMAQFGGALAGSTGMGGDQSIGVPFLIEAMPRTGSLYNFVLRAQCQMKVKRPNAFAILDDLS